MILSIFAVCLATLNLSAQTAAELPYFCDFEDASENGNWQFANENQTNQWFIGTAVNHSTDGQN